MKQTLTTNEIADLLRQDENAGWSYNGSKALAEYLDQLDADTGEDTEFDRVAIRCEFSEYETAFEAAQNYGFEADDEADDEAEIESRAFAFLNEQTTAIAFPGGVIVRDF